MNLLAETRNCQRSRECKIRFSLKSLQIKKSEKQCPQNLHKSRQMAKITHWHWNIKTISGQSVRL